MCRPRVTAQCMKKWFILQKLTTDLITNEVFSSKDQNEISKFHCKSLLSIYNYFTDTWVTAQCVKKWLILQELTTYLITNEVFSSKDQNEISKLHCKSLFSIYNYFTDTWVTALTVDEKIKELTTDLGK